MHVYVNIINTGGPFGGIIDPIITHLDNEANTVTGAKQVRLWRDITDRTITQAYYLPLVEGDIYWYINPHKVKGFQPHLQAYGSTGFWFDPNIAPA